MLNLVINGEVPPNATKKHTHYYFDHKLGRIMVFETHYDQQAGRPPVNQARALPALRPNSVICREMLCKHLQGP